MRKEADQRLEDTGRPTIYDVASRARVSPATVSKVLRGVTTVGEANASRVLDAVRALDYRRDPLAANLRRSRRSLIGLVVPDFRNPFFGSMIAAIERCSAASGYKLVTVSSDRSEETETRRIEDLLDWRVAGLIVIPSGAAFPGGRALQAASVPTVLLDRISGSIAFDGVGVDNRAASARMVDGFYDMGHRELLLAASSCELPNMRERIEGARAAANARRQPMRLEILECGSDLDSVTSAITRRFVRGPVPAVFALFIEATLAVLREASRRGLAIPGDLSVAGFDDSDWLQVMHPPVAAVIQPVEAMAQAAWERLIGRIDHEATRAADARIACEIDLRGSIAPPGVRRAAATGSKNEKSAPQRIGALKQSRPRRKS